MRIISKSAQTAQSAGIAQKTRVTKTRLVLVFNLARVFSPIIEQKKVKAMLSLITFDTLLKIFSFYAR